MKFSGKMKVITVKKRMLKEVEHLHILTSVKRCVLLCNSRGTLSYVIAAVLAARCRKP